MHGKLSFETQTVKYAVMIYNVVAGFITQVHIINTHKQRVTKVMKLRQR